LGMRDSLRAVGKDIGKALAFGFLSFIVLIPLAAYSRHGGVVESITSFLLEPGFRVGHWIGELIFPDYSKLHSTGSYVVPLIGLFGEFLQVVLLWLVGIRAVRYLRTEQQVIS